MVHLSALGQVFISRLKQKWQYEHNKYVQMCWVYLCACVCIFHSQLHCRKSGGSSPRRPGSPLSVPDEFLSASCHRKHNISSSFSWTCSITVPTDLISHAWLRKTSNAVCDVQFVCEHCTCESGLRSYLTQHTPTKTSATEATIRHTPAVTEGEKQHKRARKLSTG